MRQFECFKDLADSELAVVARRLVPQQAGPGEIVFAQGDRQDCAYLLSRGEIAVTLALEGREPRTLSTLGPGSILGEIGLLTGEPRSATAEVRTACEMYRVDRDQFESSLGLGERWAVQLLLLAARTLSRRLRALDAELATVIESGSPVPRP